MNVLVLGANGAVGQIVIVELLKLGHEVTALARNASAIQLIHPWLTVIQGNPTNTADLQDALAGQDAVLSTLGARTNKKTTLRTDVASNLVCGMRKQHVRRLVWLDAAGVGSSKEFVQRSSFLFGRIIMPFFLNHMYNDAALADSIIEKQRMRVGHRPSDVLHQQSKNREPHSPNRHESDSPAGPENRSSGCRCVHGRATNEGRLRR